MKTVKELLSDIKKQCLGVGSSHRSWNTNKEATQLVRKALGISLHYSKVLGYTQQEVLQALEDNRSYNINNYYPNLPKFTKNTHIFDSDSDVLRFFKDKKFKCPACGGISNNPYECDTKIPKDTKSGVCDWKSYGLFGCLGEGFTFVIKSSFLQKPNIQTIFKPVYKTQYKAYPIGTPINHNDLYYSDKWTEVSDSMVCKQSTTPILRISLKGWE